MSDAPPIRLELVSNPVFLSGARELISAVSKRLGFDDLECSKIALAVDEALCNVIRHGYKRALDRPIWIAIFPEGDVQSPTGVRVVIEDEAKQVEPDQLRGRELDDIRPGGLGVHIIREVMDEARYEKREEGVGMRLTLVKHRQSADEPAVPPRTNATASMERSAQSR